jgi:4-aminobutyrate aminotransferase
MRSNCIVPPAGLWRAVQNICDQHRVKLIFDEIPAGLGKTGRFFAHEHFGTTPDVVVLGKALGGGILPIAAVLADAGLDVAPELALGHYTHEKNPVTARAALTTIEIIEDEGLVGRAERLGLVLEAQICERIAGKATLITGVRGLGLLRAISFRTRPGMMEAQIVAAGLKAGVSFTMKGPNVLGFSPPLVISDADLGCALSAVAGALDGM